MKRLLHGEEKTEYITHAGRCMNDETKKLEIEDYNKIDLEDIEKDKNQDEYCMEKCTDDENCTAYSIDPIEANMCINMIKPVIIDVMDDNEDIYTCKVKNIIYKEVEHSEVFGHMMEEIIEKGEIPEEERCNHNK